MKKHGFYVHIYGLHVTMYESLRAVIGYEKYVTKYSVTVQIPKKDMKNKKKARLEIRLYPFCSCYKLFQIKIL